jgi:hypothetical protein
MLIWRCPVHQGIGPEWNNSPDNIINIPRWFNLGWGWPKMKRLCPRVDGHNWFTSLKSPCGNNRLGLMNPAGVFDD